MAKKDNIALLNELVTDTRLFLLQSNLYNPWLQGGCIKAVFYILNSKSNPKFLQLHTEGKFTPNQTEVYYMPWSSGGEPVAEHYITLWQSNSDEDGYVIDPTGSQFTALREELNGYYLLKNQDYPWHIVRVTDRNPDVFRRHQNGLEQQL